MTIKLGITGGIGSGKSLVSHLLEVMGVPVYIADTEAKRLTANDPEIRRELIALLGKEVYQGENLNKPLLARYLFGDPDQARNINNIIHPRVKADFRRWADAHHDRKIIGMEAAILIEAGFVDEVDKVVMVYAPSELRIKRVLERDGCSREEVIRRMESQMSDEEKKRLAHYTIFNDESRPVMTQVETLLASLR